MYFNGDYEKSYHFVQNHIFKQKNPHKSYENTVLCHWEKSTILNLSDEFGLEYK